MNKPPTYVMRPGAPQVMAPPGTPPQQYMQGTITTTELYCGPISWVIGVLVFPCIAFCPVDTRQVTRPAPVLMHNPLQHAYSAPVGAHGYPPGASAPQAAHSFVVRTVSSGPPSSTHSAPGGYATHYQPYVPPAGMTMGVGASHPGGSGSGSGSGLPSSFPAPGYHPPAADPSPPPPPPKPPKPGSPPPSSVSPASVVPPSSAPSPPASAPPPVRIRALVIGIDAYSDPVPGRLANAAHDARCVHEAFTKLTNASSILLLDPTKSAMEAALLAWRDGAAAGAGGGGDGEEEPGTVRGMRTAKAGAEPAPPAPVRTLGVFFFAGHGLQVHGANYLLPSDFAPPSKGATLPSRLSDTADGCVSLERVEKAMRQAGVSAGAVLLDCCRNVPDFLAEVGAHRGAGESASTRALPHGLCPANPALHDLMVTFATAPGATALDRSSVLPDHSPFSAALLRALSQPRRLLELNPFLVDAVMEDTRAQQRPHVGGSFGVSAGDILLG